MIRGSGMIKDLMEFIRNGDGSQEFFDALSVDACERIERLRGVDFSNVPSIEEVAEMVRKAVERKDAI